MYRPFKVYLAGPIYGQTFDQANDWRDRAIQRLAPEIAGYSPLRGKEFLEEHIEVYGHPIEEHPLLAIKSILNRDLNDVQTSDAILMNLLGATQISVGSLAELFWAYLLRKPLVLVIEPKEERHLSPHSHAWIEAAAPYVVQDLDIGIDVVRSILLPNPGSLPFGFNGN